MNKTIAAIATPIGNGGIAIIRISGNEALNIADKVFRGKTPISLSEPYKMQYGKVFDRQGKLTDKVLCVYMKAPHSYTGEETVEIHCHGGYISAKKTLDAVLYSGASMASPGEFTKRAFLNGKLDLAQAEAVADLICAKTDEAFSEAVNRLDGALSREINSVRNLILDITAQLLVAADYPEEDIDYLLRNEFSMSLKKTEKILTDLIVSANTGVYLKNGIFCVIAGKPNAGKSSLLNALCGREKAIVTDVAGTTRDVVEEYINIGGIEVHLCDTAGIREAEGIEGIGVGKAREYIEKADICIALLDASYYTDEDRKILEIVKGKKQIVVANKSDVARLNTDGNEDILSVSAKTGDGINELKNKILRIATDGDLYTTERVMLTNIRQKEACIRAKEAISSAILTLDDGFPADLAASDLENAALSLGEITGLTVSEEIIDKIFSKFCLGK